MNFFKEYFTDIQREEDSIKIFEKNPTINNNKGEYIDTNNLAKITLSWLMGGIVSLMPTFIYIWSDPRWRELTKILQQFFSNKDLFLVITTLTAGAMFEVFCSHKKGIAVYISVTIGVILMVFSLLIFSLLLFNSKVSARLEELPYIGVILLGVCFVYSIISYVGVCWKGR